jgi:signal transduction histidine kinase
MSNAEPKPEADALKRAEAALRAIATTANHDLRAPVRHIQVFAELLEREQAEALGEDGRDYLARIQGSAQRLGALVETLVDYARVVSTPVEPQRLDLTALAAAAAKPVKAEIEVGPLPAAQGDASLIERIFAELFANAAAHAPGAMVSVSGRATPAGGAEVRIADTGPGIEPRHAEAVFEWLRRMTASDLQGGHGAGLAICKHIIEAHGGDIRIDPDCRDGLAVVFTLPPADRGGD